MIVRPHKGQRAAKAANGGVEIDVYDDVHLFLHR